MLKNSKDRKPMSQDQTSHCVFRVLYLQKKIMTGISRKNNVATISYKD